MTSPRLSQHASPCLADYRWPGNVRQIENLCRQLVIGARGGVIDVDDLPADIRQLVQDVPALAPVDWFPSLVKSQTLTADPRRYEWMLAFE
jgi:DNA-binding NtrC family response regulator